jgi:hypothetical protein
MAKHVPPFYCSIDLRNSGSVASGSYRFGMQFVSLAFEDTCLLPNRVARLGGIANLFRVMV